MKKVILASSDLEQSIKFWSGLLQMQIFEKSETKAVLGFGEDQAKLELVAIGIRVACIPEQRTGDLLF